MFPPGSLFVSRVWCGGPGKSKRAGACFHAITPWGFPQTRVRGEREKRTYVPRKRVCGPDGESSGEILGRDIGPQATNSYDDIDSYGESSGDVHPAIYLSLSPVLRVDVAPISTISCLYAIRPRVSAVRDSRCRRSFVPLSKSEIGTSDTRAHICTRAHM